MIDFGTDLSCIEDLDPACTLSSGRRLLAEAILRRLITPRGRLIGDPEYGTDITDMLNDDLTPAGVAGWQAAIVVECRKDERIEGARCKITVPPGGTGAYKIDITLEDAEGPFDLTFTLTEPGKIEEFLLTEAA